MVKFLHILEEQNTNFFFFLNGCQKIEFKMAAKFKTKFAYVTKKTLVQLSN
jgi:hypothetical protein